MSEAQGRKLWSRHVSRLRNPSVTSQLRLFASSMVGIVGRLFSGGNAICDVGGQSSKAWLFHLNENANISA
jgi:hypothetical protein